MRTTALEVTSGRRRRTYTAAFKTELVSQCLQLGVSSAAVAVSHGMNPNVLRRWIKESGRMQASECETSKAISHDVAPAFVALPLKPAASTCAGFGADIQMQVQRNGTTVLVTWPPEHVAGSAAWVREVLG